MSSVPLRAYQQAVEFYRLVEKFRGPPHLHLQLLRSASSIALNLAEGYGRPHSGDRRRYFKIALGSLKETQAVLDLCAHPSDAIVQSADHLGGSVYRLWERTKLPL